MALTKQAMPITFAQGLDLKTDPNQVAPGRFLTLVNSIFDKAGRLTKRNGYGSLTSLPNTASTTLTTFNGNLTAVGTAVQAYSSPSEMWVDRGKFYPISLETLPLIRSNTNQSQADSVVSANGLVLTAYTDNVTSGSSTIPVYKFVIADAMTGQNILPPTVITPPTGTVVGSPRAFLLKNYFIVVFTNLIGGVNHLKYIAINSLTPTVVGTAVDITAQYVPSSTVSFDGVVVNNALYLSWPGTDGGGAIRTTYIDHTLLQHNTVVDTGQSATLMSLTADQSGSTPVIYITSYDSATGNTTTMAKTGQLNPVLVPTTTRTGGSVLNITTAANNQLLTIYYEISNFYGYDSTIQTDFIQRNTVSQSGTVTSPTVLVRSVGLASKAFTLNGDNYFLAIYNSQFQPTYFLIDDLGNVVSKLAYSNGGVYYTTGLPGVTLTGDLAQVAFFYKDLIQAVNKTQNPPTAAGIYSQTGINLASFTIGVSSIITAEIGNDLNLSGGFLWMYDGYSPVEQGFHLWPDYVEATGSATGGGLAPQTYFYQATYEWSDNQGNVFRSAPSIPVEVDFTNTTFTPITFTSTFSQGDTVLTVSSVTGLVVGQIITDMTTPATILVGTTITKIVGSTITISQPTTAAGSPDTLQTVDTGSVTINVPTLRLTYKTANPVKIVIYRWSTALQNYYQITSIIAPVLNDTTIDYITYTDTQPDAAIIGNNLIYTTGGVLENIAAPATDTMTLFQSRLFLVDSEDKNLLWFSKQVIEATPVEMSDLLTIYVAPTTSAQGSTGPISALSALDDKLIVFKKDAIYYINGAGPDNTGANSQFSEPIFITATVGSTNQQSIVFTPSGLMFQSDKGIWLLGRDLSTNYIGAPVETLTQTALVQSAVNVPGTNQVRFTLDSGITLMYDYYFGQWATFSNVPAISSTLFQGLHTYLNNKGAVLQETPGLYLDASNPVLMSFTTSWFNFNGLQGYERAYFMYILGTYISPHKLQVQVAYDYLPTPQQTSTVTPLNFAQNYGQDTLWGSTPVWGGASNVEEARIFFEKGKCQAFQLIVNELYDPSYGQAAGAGLTISGLNLIIGAKKGYRTQQAAKSFG